MNLRAVADQGWPIAKLRFHPTKRLLASVAGPHTGVCVWEWDESGNLNRLAPDQQPAVVQIRDAPLQSCENPTPGAGGDRVIQFGRKGEAGIRDVAWHPRENLLAVVGGGRAIELWRDGQLVNTFGQRPTADQYREYNFGHSSGGKLEVGTAKLLIPIAQQGYGAVVFSASGSYLVADGGDHTEVYDVTTGEIVDSFWGSDSTLALHPEGEILATLSSEQVMSTIRFSRLTDRWAGYNVELNLAIDGYRRIVFSPGGDALAVMGHAYGIGFRLYEFPSLRMIFELDFENWKDVWSRLWALYRGAERYQARPDGSYPYEFIQDLWTVNDRLSFDPDGGTLLFGTMDGQVVGVDLADVSKPSGVWAVDDGPVLALDVSERHAMLATARYDGRIKLWQLDRNAAQAAAGAKPITETFCKMYKPVESTAPQGEFRTTDGKRWYNLDAMGDEELDEDAPPWAHMAQWASWFRSGNDCPEPDCRRQP